MSALKLIESNRDFYKNLHDPDAAQQHWLLFSMLEDILAITNFLCLPDSHCSDDLRDPLHAFLGNSNTALEKLITDYKNRDPDREHIEVAVFSQWAKHQLSMIVELNGRVRQLATQKSASPEYKKLAEIISHVSAPYQHESEMIRSFTLKHEDFQLVLSGKMTIADYFQSGNSREDFLELFKVIFREDLVEIAGENSLFDEISIASAWITKIRFNEEMTNAQFISQIQRAEKIFSGTFKSLDFQSTDITNDQIAFMWGMEVLNGPQIFDSGTTRVRLSEDVSLKVLEALEQAGCTMRLSTHAVGTKFTECGLGKDIADESLRKFTPRGAGALLVHPVSCDGQGSDYMNPSLPLSDQLKAASITRFDLLLKSEDYGFNDSLLHSRVHGKRGYLNVIDANTRAAYDTGHALIERQSSLAKECIGITGKGRKIHRKEHLSELGKNANALVQLLNTGNKLNPPLFPEFKTAFFWRIKFPFFEKKIVAISPMRYGLGKFIMELSKNMERLPASQNKNLQIVRPLLERFDSCAPGSFKQTLEGNEVLANCSSGKIERAFPLIKGKTVSAPHIQMQDMPEVILPHLEDSEARAAIQRTLGPLANEIMIENSLSYTREQVSGPLLSGDSAYTEARSPTLFGGSYRAKVSANSTPLSSLEALPASTIRLAPRVQLSSDFTDYRRH